MLDQEAFFAALDVERGGAVAEAEAVFFVDDVEDAADVEGPKAEGVGFYGDGLVGVDFYFWIGDADPAEVELLPAAEGGFGCGEGCLAVADFAAGVVADVAGGEMLALEVGCGFGDAGHTVGDGEVPGDCEFLLDEGLGRFVEREHRLSMAWRCSIPLSLRERTRSTGIGSSGYIVDQINFAGYSSENANLFSI